MIVSYPSVILCSPSPAPCPSQRCRYGAVADSEVTNQDVLDFEAKWQLPVCRVRHFGAGHPQQQQQRSPPNPNEVAAVLNVIVERLWIHRQRQQQQQAAVDPALI